ncbi:MAG: hypothetical protein V1790_05385 [Planctomycetota bacterium]
MDRGLVVAILNELLTLEQRSLAPRLLESTVFVSDLSVAAFSLVQRMAHATGDHTAALTKLVLDSGGSPGPRSSSVATADLHFQELQHVLPRLIADQQALIRKYAIAAQRLADEPHALALATRILQRHQQDLERLHELSPVPKVGAA